MRLAVPLSSSQIEAAKLLHERLEQWRLSDAALRRLRDAMPGFDSESCLLKTLAVNALYGTQVFAIVRMAQHIVQCMRAVDLTAADNRLVTKIALLPIHRTEKQRRFVSFAAKFCHFFVDDERFPIYDEAARVVLKLHLHPSIHAAGNDDQYAAFCANFEGLRTACGFGVATRELDRYLWLTGMYMKWERERGRASPQVNAELQRLFNEPDERARRLLDVMLPRQTRQVA